LRHLNDHELRELFGKTRLVPLHPTTIAALDEYLRTTG
jgi:hypothetical protein